MHKATEFGSPPGVFFTKAAELGSPPGVFSTPYPMNKATELGELATSNHVEKIYLPPSDIRFTHAWISQSFRSGLLLQDAIACILGGSMRFADFPPLVCVRRGRNVYSLSNRRLYVARELQRVHAVETVQVELYPFMHDVVQRERDGVPKWERAFSTNNDGISVEVRISPSDVMGQSGDIELAAHGLSSSLPSMVATNRRQKSINRCGQELLALVKKYHGRLRIESWPLKARRYCEGEFTHPPELVSRANLRSILDWNEDNQEFILREGVQLQELASNAIRGEALGKKWRIDANWIATCCVGDSVLRVPLSVDEAKGLSRHEWENRFSRRASQIRIAKATNEYKRWQEFISRYGPSESSPQTPRIAGMNSKGEFEKQYARWRIELHRVPGSPQTFGELSAESLCGSPE